VRRDHKVSNPIANQSIIYSINQSVAQSLVLTWDSCDWVLRSEQCHQLLCSNAAVSRFVDYSAFDVPEN